MNRDDWLIVLFLMLIPVWLLTLGAAHAGWLDRPGENGWIYDFQTLITGIVALVVGGLGFLGLQRQVRLTREQYRADIGDLDPEFYVEPEPNAPVGKSQFWLVVTNRN